MSAPRERIAAMRRSRPLYSDSAADERRRAAQRVLEQPVDAAAFAVVLRAALEQLERAGGSPRTAAEWLDNLVRLVERGAGGADRSR